MLNQIRNQTVNPPVPRIDATTRSTPPSAGSRIALIPDGGIPAVGVPGTAEVSTGTGTGDPDRLVSSAVCEIYRISQEPVGQIFNLRAIPGMTRRVFNISGSDVPAGFALIDQMKSGHWVVVVSSVDRWEFAVMDVSAVEGIQGIGSTHATVTNGPALGEVPTDESVEISYVHGRAVEAAETVTLQWKRGEVYAFPWDCNIPTTGTGTGS
jgi:hypothetical protein